MSAQQRKYVRASWRQDKARYPKRALLFERSIIAVWVLRFGQYGDAVGFTPLRLAFRIAYQLLMLTSEVLTGISIPKSVVVGPGLRIFHAGGIVIHERARIGNNCTLRHGVTIGVRSVDGGVPELGDNVDVGACAMILGGLHIGNDTKIGAGALVQVDLPDNAVAYAPRASLVIRQPVLSDDRPAVAVVQDAAFATNATPSTPYAWPKSGESVTSEH